MWHIANAESFRPIFSPNPNVGGSKQAPKRIPLSSSFSSTTTTTSATTIRPLTTISATLKSKVSFPNSKPSQAPSRQSPQAAPRSTNKHSDNIPLESKDKPVAEAWRSDFNGYRRQRRPYYYPAPYYNYNARSRRRPNLRPYYTNPNYGYSAPYEDYRFETDFLDPNPYTSSKAVKTKNPSDSSKDYAGVIDTDIGQFYDSSSATFQVGSGYKSYDSSQPSNGYFSSGKGSSSSTGTGTGTGSGFAYDYLNDSDDGNYKFSTTKPRTKAKTPRAPIKTKNTRFKYNSYATDNDDYKYSSDDTSGFGASGLGSDSDDRNVNSEQNSYGQAKFLYPSAPQQHTIYQTALKTPKPPKTKPIKTTTYTPPIKISDSSIDILTKPLGSATFNLNLSPGTVYQPPSINYNPIGGNYKIPLQPAIQQIPSIQNIQPIQPIPIQPPATSYGE